MPAFVELTLIVATATVVSSLMKFLRQPLVAGYILSGILLGPHFLNVLQSVVVVELFSKIGIIALLFIVGLSLNPETVKEAGKVSVIAGVCQVVFTTLIGFFILLKLGFSNIPALYVAIALTMSSTIIIMKLLSDKGDLGKLYGKISVGILLIQDFFATIILLLLSVGQVEAGGSFAFVMGELFSKAVIIFAGLYIVSRFILPKIASFLASSQELLFLFSISWGLGLSALFHMLGFSIEIGALFAGIALSVSPFSFEMASRMKPLRDFFVVLFFVLLGSQIEFANLGAIILPAILLSLYVLIGNPIIVYVILSVLGYKRKTAFQTGVTVAQISEFSLILIAYGLSLGHIDKSVVTLVTLVGIITIALSTYLIMYSEKLWKRFDPFLKFFDFNKKHKSENGFAGEHFDVIIFGYDKVGEDFVRAAEKLGANFVAVDFDPNTIKKLQREKIPFKYGDAEDAEFLDEIGLTNAKMIISTIPNISPNLALVKSYRKKNAEGIIIALSHNIKDTEDLYTHGASYVVMPHFLGAHHASHMIERYGFKVEEFEKERNIQMAKLAKRGK